ncbi:hypothetical protein, conserved [Babesia ovata]|uniref:6-Cys domain-containing protein n=1 Tax=Babesia ovata TaxID=189622 RepID=A0A2H6KGK1_9APIC|nr:uncharacterized protein BOVATA_036230 [Babesia ovata]GBE62130.1 hypothetical protein, conserved [Babesia ovata]
MVTHYIRFIETLRCDFGHPAALLSRNALVMCHIDTGNSSSATAICPNRVNDTEYIWYPQATLNDGVHLKTYVSENGQFRSTLLSEVVRYEAMNNLIRTVSTPSTTELHMSLSFSELFVIGEHRLIFLCGPRHLILSAALQSILGGLKSANQTQEFPSTPSTPLTQEISKIGHGLGVLFLYRGRQHLPLQGCGNRPSPLFAPDNVVTVDPVTRTRSCVVDPMSKPPIGFLCEGRIEPNDCMKSLLDKNGGIMTVPEPFPYWGFEDSKPWVIATYFQELALPPFYGECRCIDSETGQLKARIEIRSKDEYVCDIASMIFRNRVRPIRGPWCSVVLHPGSTLTIRLPANVFNSAAADEDFSAVPFSQLPSAYEYESKFMPKDLTRLRQQTDYYDLETYDEISYNKGLAGDALELDVSQIARGEVKLKYHLDKPLALRRGSNSFFYHWTLISKNENVPDKIRAVLNVSYAFTHYYRIVGCDQGTPGVFDGNIIRRHCSTKEIGNGIGQTYECTFNRMSNMLWAGIHCRSDEELLPDNCKSTGYNMYSNSIMPFPRTVRNATTYPIPGFQVFDMWFQHSPLSHACVCVDQLGYEKSKLVLELSHEESHTYIVRRETRFHRLFPYLRLPWHKVGLLLEGHTSTRFIMLHYTSKKYVKLHPGTMFSMSCVLDRDVQGIANNGAMETTWLPNQPKEFHYTVVHTSHGRALVSTPHKDIMVSTNSGLEIVHHDESMRFRYKRLDITSRRGAVLISKDPHQKKYVSMTFVCGKSQQLEDLSPITGDALSSDASVQPFSNITELSEQYTWNIVKVNVETTDPYMQGCGVTYASDELFKPETPPLYDGDGQSQFGCKIDLQAAKEAAFYCPAPYVLDPPNCFSQVYVDGEVKSMSELSKSLVASRSNHFVILRFDSSRVGQNETLRQTPPLECRCVTVKGVVLSTIQIGNYYSKL